MDPYSTDPTLYLMDLDDLGVVEKNWSDIDRVLTKPGIDRILMILASLKNWGREHSNGAKLVKIRGVKGRFVVMFWFENHKKTCPI